jgi:hypothetical protein
MADQDVVSLSGNVLEDISSFRGESVDFELDSINRVRESFGVPPIPRDSATKAILHAMTEDAPDHLVAETLAAFFGGVDKVPPLPRRDEADGAAYISKIGEMTQGSNIQGPRGPSLGCVVDGYPLGVYLYAKTLALRSN